MSAAVSRTHAVALVVMSLAAVAACERGPSAEPSAQAGPVTSGQPRTPSGGGGGVTESAREGASGPAARRAVPTLPRGASPSAVFDSGRRLIEENAGDSLGKDREALEEGMRRVERALNMGFSDRVRALKTLESAHNAFVAEVARSNDEARSHLHALQSIYRELGRLEPDRPEWGMALSSTLLSDKEQMAVLRGVSARFPGYWPAAMALADLLCRGGHSAEGARLIRTAASRTPPPEAESLEGEMVAAAWRCGGDVDAARVTAVLEARRPR